MRISDWSSDVCSSDLYGLAQLDDTHRNDPAVFDVANKIKIVPDDAMTQRYPETTPASVTITYRDGTMRHQEIELPPGDPRRSTGDDAVFNKFDVLVSPILGKDKTQSVRHRLMALEDATDISQLIREVRASLN